MPPKQKALEKQALLEVEREKKAAVEREKAEDAEWAVGAKKGGKQADREAQEEAKRLKALEKQALEQADQDDLTGIVVKKKPATKKKAKDDSFKMLEAAIASAPKSKAQKEKEEKDKKDKEKKLKESAALAAREAVRLAEQERLAKLAAKGIVTNQDDLFIPINNRLEEDDEDATGIENAIDALNVDGSVKTDDHPERRQKALYYAYYEEQLTIMREDHPGLKLSQYKERIFSAWKTAPENPLAQQRKAGNTVFEFADK